MHWNLIPVIAMFSVDLRPLQLASLCPEKPNRYCEIWNYWYQIENNLKNADKNIENPTPTALTVTSGVVPMGHRVPPIFSKDEKWSSHHLRTDTLRSTILQSRCSFEWWFWLFKLTKCNPLISIKDDCRNLLEQCPAPVKFYRRLSIYHMNCFDVLYPCDSVAKYG